MNVLIDCTKNLPGPAPSHTLSYAPVGWGTSAVLHAVGAVTVWAACAMTTTFETPELYGDTARIELTATWAPPPVSPATIEITPAEPQVLVMPNLARIGRRTYRPASTDVSQPTAEELAMAELLMSRPMAKQPRREDALPTERLSQTAPSAPPIQRQPVALDMATVEVEPPVPSSQRQAAGTNDRTPPRLLRNRPPTYPARAMVDRLQGTVLLRLGISVDGRVADVEVFTSSGHGVLNAAAVRAVRGWRFAPARRDGRPVTATVRLPVRFALD